MTFSILETFPVGPLQCNCTILGDPVTKEAVVIDPGGDEDYIIERLDAQGLKLVAIWHTHAHFDHFLASGKLRALTGAPLSLHADDRILWDNLETQCARFNLPFEPVPPPDETLEHEQVLSTGDLSLKVLHTPGHSPGSCCFHAEKDSLLISGDTLFRGSIGRTDLWGGDFSQIKQSIQERLFGLDEATRVIPGHGGETSIRFELEHNILVRS